jgi:outer membrane protein assembly factor BamB
MRQLEERLSLQFRTEKSMVNSKPFCEDWDMRIKRRHMALIVLAVSFLGSGLASPVADAAVRSVAPAAGAKGSDWLLCPELLDHARLKIVWQQTLPLKEGEGFSAITLLGDRLYLRSDRNYMWSLDAAKGEVAFSRSVAPQGIPVLGLGAHGDSLISVVGNQLTECSRITGTEQRIGDLELSVVAPPVRNSHFYYVAAGDRRLHVLRAHDLVRIFKVAPENESLITTVLADDNMAVFGTSRGDIVAVMADAPRKLWQFKAPEAVAGSLVRDGSSFYFACRDTNVYRIDMTETASARLAWRFQTESVLDRCPRVTGGLVYQYAPGRGLSAIDKQTGQAAWHLPDGLDLLAEAQGKAYVITTVRTLAVVDNSTGKRLYSVNCAPVIGHASNTGDARIYVVDAQGRVACLEPTR